VGTITRNVRRVTELIDEVLLLGKVEAGQMRCAPAPMDLADFCRRLTDEIHSATDRRCPIQLELESGLPQAQGDENVLRQLIGNLLSNAVKYSPPGQHVVFKANRSQANAVFVVCDAGIGIPEADRAKLFTAFHRASNVGQIRGTGLGLTIVKRCVDLHRGQISFATAEGKGTTFTVTVPLFTISKTRPL
jgi:signal transduction histidine kinase